MASRQIAPPKTSSVLDGMEPLRAGAAEPFPVLAGKPPVSRTDAVTVAGSASVAART